MFKTISTQQVRLGMYIRELKGAWVDHPFWQRKFVLNNPKDLEELFKSAVKEVVIDTSKGLYVSTETVDVKVEKFIETVAVAPVESTKKVSVAEEMQAAKYAIEASKKAVATMFNDVRLGKVVNAESAMPLVDAISASIDRNKAALISLARLKTQDDYSYMHSVAVCALMTGLAKEISLSEGEIKQAAFAGLLHDIGKAEIPLEILNKPDALTDSEFLLIKEHPEKGHRRLVQAGITDAVALDVCLHHHEKIDGKGYPHNLDGAAISLFAKMGAICDVYDAITSNRPYKLGWEPSASLKKMVQWQGHFDADLLKAFVKSMGIYPVGSVVLLKSKRLAVVIDQSQKSLLQPIVKVFFSTQSKVRIPVEVIDLSKPMVIDEVAALDSAQAWDIKNIEELWAG